MKEHSGGAPGQVLEYSGDHATPILTEAFPFHDVDHLRDHLREGFNQAIPQVRLNGELDKFFDWILSFIDARTEAEVTKGKSELITRFSFLILEADKPKQRVVEINIAAGTPLGLSKTGPRWAKDFGVKKQAIQQAVERIQKELDLPKNSVQRDDCARRRMRLRNFRHDEG